MLHTKKFLISLFVSFVFASQGMGREPIHEETGPLEMGKNSYNVTEDFPVALRYESLGNTVLNLDIVGKGYLVPKVWIEGPLTEENGDFTPVGDGKKQLLTQPDTKKRSFEADITLEKPGVYRVIVEKDRSPNGSVDVKAECKSNCTRPELTLDEIKGLDFLKNFKLEVAVHEFDAIRKLLETFRSPTQNQSDEQIQVRLEKYFESCEGERGGAQPLNLPGHSHIKYGQFKNLALTACQAVHSQKMAKLLTALAVDNGSWVTYNGQAYFTPETLIQALMETHQVELRHERTFANFLSFTVDDKYNTRIPLWLKTGYQSILKRELVVPAGHTQYAWRISGPLMNVRITFYLGIYGAAFFPQDETRPIWAGKEDGLLTVFSRQSLEGSIDPVILKSFDKATAYLRLNRKQILHEAHGLAANGYGVLGFCNDSYGFMLAATEDNPTEIMPYPLIRSHKFNDTVDLTFEEKALFNRLPDDALEKDRANVLSRVLSMYPLDWNKPNWLDSKLQQEYDALRAEFGVSNSRR